MTRTPDARALLAALALVLASAAAVAQPTGAVGGAAGDKPVPPLPAAQRKAGDDPARVRTASLPAKGLFVGDQLSDGARARLAELIVEAAGLQVEIALLVPTGPWQVDGAGQGDRDLTEARLKALRKYLTDRGFPPHRVLVESRIDQKLKEPRLDVQLIGQPAD